MVEVGDLALTDAAKTRRARAGNNLPILDWLGLRADALNDEDNLDKVASGYSTSSATF